MMYHDLGKVEIIHSYISLPEGHEHEFEAFVYHALRGAHMGEAGMTKALELTRVTDFRSAIDPE